jgi:hypothetical protein
VGLFRACDPPKPISSNVQLDLSSLIINDALNWTSEVVDVTLGGELFTSVILTRLQYHASHHDPSVTCHVSAIQGGTNIYYFHLSSHQNRQRSDTRNTNDTDFRG